MDGAQEETGAVDAQETQCDMEEADNTKLNPLGIKIVMWSTNNESVLVKNLASIDK